MEQQECLICFVTCSDNVKKHDDSADQHHLFPGAGDCQSLKKQLEHLFIVRQLLGIPLSWCEKVLQRKGDHDDGFEEARVYSHPDSWFWVCSSCLSGTVYKALAIHQQILTLESKMRQLKANVKVTMSQRFGSKQRREGRIDDEIRELVCASDLEPEGNDKDDWRGVKWEMDEVVQVPKVKTRRKKGRPKGSLKRRIMSDLADNEKTGGDLKGDNQDMEYENRLEVDEHGDLFTPSEKRRRGRPKGTFENNRKINQINFDVDCDGNSSGTCSNTDNDDPDWGGGGVSSDVFSSPVVPPLIRKRGRPKRNVSRNAKINQFEKSKVISTVSDEDNDGNSSSSSNSEDGHPGWGGGEVEMQISEEETGGESTHDSSSDCFSIPTTHVKRKRGRPKGSKSSGNSTKKKRHSTIFNRCSQCPSKFLLSENLQLHQVAHSKSLENGDQFACSICSFPSLDKQELDLHKKTKHSTWKRRVSHSCSLCSFKIGKLKLLHDHYLQKHEDNGNLDKLLPKECSTCGKFYPDSESLTSHEQRVHPELCGKVEDKPIPCDQCDQQFASRIHLQSHIKNTHSRVNRHICEECGAGFQFQSRLLHHKVKHNVGKREWVCHLCGVDYPYERTLQTHYKKVHPDYEQKQNKNEGGDGEQFKCKYCDLTSPFSVVISRHLESHKRYLGHQCQLCSKYYFNAQGLKRHMRINHPVTSEKVECPYCKKEFSNLEYMKGHVRQYCKLKDLEESSEVTTTPSIAIAQSGEIEMKIEQTYNVCY